MADDGKSGRLYLRSTDEMEAAIDRLANALGGPWTRSSVVTEIVRIFLSAGHKTALVRLKSGEIPDPLDAQRIAEDAATLAVQIAMQPMSKDRPEIIDETTGETLTEKQRRLLGAMAASEAMARGVHAQKQQGKAHRSEPESGGRRGGA